MSFSTWAIENGKIIEYTCTSNQGQAEYEKNKGGRYNDQGKKPVLSGCNAFLHSTQRSPFYLR